MVVCAWVIVTLITDTQETYAQDEASTWVMAEGQQDSWAGQVY
jgi:hypothetical protein